MAVKIGHASIDENGKAVSGNAGDQTGKEVCTRGWYSGGWEFAARAKDSAVAERIAATCEAGCANPNIGYDQNQRNTLNIQAAKVGYDLSRIGDTCECDCSAFVAVCVLAAGVDLPCSGNLPTTRSLKTALSDTGAFKILTDSKYLTGDRNLRRGDILVKPGSHTVIVLENGTEVDATFSVQLPLLRKGSTGEAVGAMQILLMGRGFDCGIWGSDGEFGDATENAVKAFQKKNSLSVDGVVGGETWTALIMF